MGKLFSVSNARNALLQLINSKVGKTGNENVDGQKTFSSSPVVPNLDTSDSSTKAVNAAFVKAVIASLPNSSSGGGGGTGILKKTTWNLASASAQLIDANALDPAIVYPLILELTSAVPTGTENVEVTFTDSASGASETVYFDDFQLDATGKVYPMVFTGALRRYIAGNLIVTLSTGLTGTIAVYALGTRKSGTAAGGGSGAASFATITGDPADNPALEARFQAISQGTLTANLAAINSLNPNTAGVIASDGAGWLQKSWTQVKTSLNLTSSDVGLPNVANVDTRNPANINQNSTHRFVSDAEKQSWNQAAGGTLGYTAENAANKGQAGGYASLDGSGKVPSTQLPSYVDDVLEYATQAGFPATGEAGKIYIVTSGADINKQYRWSGTQYVLITGSPGSTDSVTEGSTNKYFTEDRVRGTVLNGFSTAVLTAVIAADSILTAIGKLQAQVTSALSQITGKQAQNANLDTIAGLTPTNGNIMQATSSGWASRTMAQFFASVGTGTRNSTTVLHGDLVWKAPASSGGGTVSNPIGSEEDLTVQINAANLAPTTMFVLNMTSNIPLNSIHTLPVNVIINPNGFMFDLATGGRLYLSGVGFSAEVFVGQSPVFKNASGEASGFVNGHEHLAFVSEATLTAGSANIVLTGNGWAVGTPLKYVSTGVTAGGLGSEEIFYVVSGGNTFQVSRTVGGAPIVITMLAAGAKHYFTTAHHSILVDITTNTFIKRNHPWLEGRMIRFDTSGTAPTGLTGATNFYVKNRTDHTFQLSAAAFGSAIDIQSQGSGVHTLQTEQLTQLFYPYTGRIFRTTDTWAAVGKKVRYYVHEGGTPIGGFIHGQDYWIVDKNTENLNYYVLLSETQGGSPVTITHPGAGVHYFVDASVQWIGTILPQQIPTELWDTGDVYLNKRLNLADASVSGRRATIVATPREENGVRMRLTGMHKFIRLPGDYPNRNTTLAPGVGLMQIFPDVTLEFDGAKGYEASGDRSFLIQPFSNSANMGFCKGYGFNIGSMTQQYSTYNSATVDFGNVSQLIFKDFRFERCAAYCVKVGGSGVMGKVARQVLVKDGAFINCFNQPFFIAHGTEAKIDSVSFYHDMPQAVPTGWVDFEPNDTAYDLVTDVQFTNCTFDASRLDENVGALFHTFLALQGIQTKGQARFAINRCRFYGNPAVCDDRILAAEGVDVLNISNSEFFGFTNCAIQLAGCKDVMITNCAFGDIGVTNAGVAVAGAKVIWLRGCRNVSVLGCTFKNGKFPEVTSRVIYEEELPFYVHTTIGDTMHLPSKGAYSPYYGDRYGLLDSPYELTYPGGKLTLNEQTYTFKSLDVLNYDSHRRIVLDRAITPALARITFASTAINTTTDTINVAHPFETGCRVRLLADDYTGIRLGDNPGHALPAHALPSTGRDAFGTYFVIKVDANNLKLASSYENSKNGTAIDFTSQGTGNYYLMPMFTTKFSSGTFENKDAVYDLEPTGKSLIKDRTMLLTSKTGTVTLTDSDTGMHIDDMNGNAAFLFNGVPRDFTTFHLYNFNGNDLRFKTGGEVKIFYGDTDTGVNGYVDVNNQGDVVTLVARGGHFRAVYSSEAAGFGSTSGSPLNTNFALPSMGASASASSSDAAKPPAYANDGSRVPGASGHYWMSGLVFDNTTGVGSAWYEINLGATRTFDEVQLFGMANDGYYDVSTIEPDDDTDGQREWIDYSVEYWNGSAWVNCFTPVTGNTKAKRVHSFADVTSTKVRLVVTKVIPGAQVAHLMEMEVYKRS